MIIISHYKGIRKKQTFFNLILYRYKVLIQYSNPNFYNNQAQIKSLDNQWQNLRKLMILINYCLIILRIFWVIHKVLLQGWLLLNFLMRVNQSTDLFTNLFIYTDRNKTMVWMKIFAIRKLKLKIKIIMMIVLK